MGINYSVEADPDTTAKGMLRDRPISLKHSKAISREIKGMTVEDAEEYLDAVIEGERPFRSASTTPVSGTVPTSTAGTPGATRRWPARPSRPVENAVGNADHQGSTVMP